MNKVVQFCGQCAVATVAKDKMEKEGDHSNLIFLIGEKKKKKSANNFNELVKSLPTGHCEELSDEAISRFHMVTNNEIASRSLSRRAGLAMTCFSFCLKASILNRHFLKVRDESGPVDI